MKTILLSFVVLFLLKPTLAQVAEYNFQDYQQGNVAYRGFFTRATFQGRHNDLIVRPNSSVIENRGNIAFEGVGAFFIRENQPTFKKTMDVDFRFSPQLSWTQGVTADTKTLNLPLYGQLRYLKEYYINYNQRFYGWAYRANSTSSYTQLKVASGADRDERVTQYTNMLASVSMRWGQGRMEDISNAWHAYRILNRLHYTELVTRDYLPSEINEFGQFLDRLKSERVFDQRLRNIALLQWLDQELRDNYGLTATTIKYFAELHDLWYYGILDNRIKGQRYYFEGGAMAYNEIQSSRTKGTILPAAEYGELYYGPWMKAVFEKASPVQRDFQVNGSINLYQQYAWDRNDRSGAEQKFQRWIISPYSEWLLGFYPTTRTQYEWTMALGTYIDRNSSTPDAEWGDLQAYVASQFDFVYFLRSTTYLLGSVGFSYRTSQDVRLAYEPGNIIFTPPINALGKWHVIYSVEIRHYFF